MKRFNLNQNQFSDILNLTNNVFYPLKNFVNQTQFDSIIQRMKLGKKFFPFPIFFGIDKKKFIKTFFHLCHSLFFIFSMLLCVPFIKFERFDNLFD